MPALTKSDFIQYLNCPKSLWLKKRKPTFYPEGDFTPFQMKLVRDGYAVEAQVRALIATHPDAEKFSSQWVFECGDGLLARADLVRANEDGTLDLYEIKSSTSIKDGAPDFHLKDATFQAIVAERCGYKVRHVQIVHLNSDYVRDGAVDPEALLVFADITDDVRGLIPETELEIAQALDLLAMDSIDETSCSCLALGRGRHCDSFDYFNPGIPDPSIYDLPRISQSKDFSTFVEEGRFALNDIDPAELSPVQRLVLAAHQSGAPVIDHAVIGEFLGSLTFPLHFLDYEAFASAIPMIDGAWPHGQIPFQFSLHVLGEDGALSHHEYLAEDVEMPAALLEALSQVVRPNGSVISWHKSYENTRNKEMAERFPAYSRFLNDVTARTVDLEDVFKTGYVDIAFRGSTSIKKVLPVVVPDLTYEGMDIADGTAAMEGWLEMVGMHAGEAKLARRRALLEYCEQDTLAMVRIFQFLRNL
jgi:Domain of unknown function(DUF2779)